MGILTFFGAWLKNNSVVYKRYEFERDRYDLEQQRLLITSEMLATAQAARQAEDQRLSIEAERRRIQARTERDIALIHERLHERDEELVNRLHAVEVQQKFIISKLATSQQEADGFIAGSERDRIRQLIKLKRQSLYTLRRNESIYGPGEAPVYLTNQIEILETEIEDLQHEL